jgi:succinate-semialdehyde dehydrogenase/glutarate-semialdehyde dehydrogenase
MVVKTAISENAALSRVGTTGGLADESLWRQQAYISGTWTSGQSGKTFEVTDPADGKLLGRVADLGADETRQAIAAAEQALADWAGRSAKQRSGILEKWFDLIIENRDDLARILTAEQGKPLAEAYGEIAYGASFVEWFSEEAKRVYGETIPSPSPSNRILVLKQPIGVCAAITPWNFPLAMITRKAAAALAAGCTMVVKPSDLTPFTALALAELSDRAGVPAGVLNIVTGTDAPAIGLEMCSSPVIRKLTFTGSTEVGRTLLRQAADTVKKCTLELGGNASVIVFADADIDCAVSSVMIAKFRNGGQSCIAANRIFVQADIYLEFAKRLAIRSGELRVGAGFEEGVSVGPLIDKATFRKVERHVSQAVGAGAQILVGGKCDDRGGTFFKPTVLTDVTPDMAIFREETFGPVAALFRFETEEQAIRLANTSEFGLASYVFTQNLNRAVRVAERLEAGIVGINEGMISNETAPFGGVKQSGLGREGSHHGIDEYLELKYVCIGGIK